VRRHLALLEYALGSLRRRPGRNAAILLGLVLVVAMFSSVLFLTGALVREYEAAVDAMPDLIVQRLVAGRPGLIEERHAKAMRAIPAVASAAPRLWGYYFVPSLSGNLTVVGADLGRPEVRRDLALVITRGRAPRRDGTGEMVLGEALAGFLGLEIEDELGIPVDGEHVSLELVGTFRSESALWTADVLLVGEADARRLLRVPDGHATDIAVRLTTPDESTVVARRIAAQLPGARVIDRKLLRRAYELTFDTRGGILAAMLLPALLAFLVLAWDRLAGLGPDERREIGVLKAIGWETSDVLAARMWESVLLAATGAVVGVAGSYLLVFQAGAPGLSSLLFGWSAIYPPLDLAPAVDLAQLLALVCTTVVPFVAVSIVPAWRAATLDPDQAMRGTA